MAEKIKSSKKEKEIKEDLVDMNIKSFICNGVNDRESRIITSSFNTLRTGSNIIQNKTIPYFYNELLGWTPTKNINDYFTSIK